MIYFDLLPIIRELSAEQAGRLFVAILEYADNGNLPEFGEDPVLRMAWACVQGKVDRDIVAYKEKCSKNSYNQYKRWQQEKGFDPLSFEQWKLEQDNTTEYDGIGNLPTTTTAITTIPTITSTVTTITKSNTKGTGDREGLGEEEPQTDDFERRREAGIRALYAYGEGQR